MSPSCPFVIPSPQNHPPPLYSSRASSAEGIATCPWRPSSKVPHSANPLLTIPKAQRPLWVTQDWPTLKSPCHFALPSAPLPPLDRQISEERDLACSIFAWHNSCLSYFEHREIIVLSLPSQRTFPLHFLISHSQSPGRMDIERWCDLPRSLDKVQNWKILPSLGTINCTSEVALKASCHVGESFPQR